MSGRFLIVFWLTGRCNLNCVYCYAEENRAKTEMEFETAKHVLDRMGTRPLKIQFSGGEPLLNFPLVEKICAYVRSNQIDAVFQMQTNATLLDEATARRLSALSISVGVSLDGPPEINERLRGQTADAVRGIRLLGAQRIMVGLNAVVTQTNVDTLDKLMDFAFYLGNVGGVGLDLVRCAGQGRESFLSLEATPQTLRKNLIRMAARGEALFGLTGKRVEIREIQRAKKRLLEDQPGGAYCYASCARSIVVLPDGRLYPCGSLLQKNFLIGTADHFQPDSIALLDCVAEEKSMGCGGCRYAAICPKGCPSRRIRNTGALDCVLLKTSFEIAEGSIHENIH